jgi:DMSO reductase family type II enzyme heme b subunit
MAQAEGGTVNIWHWKASAQTIADMNAKGFGTLAVQPQQDVTGKGVWKDGVWRVVFARYLEDGDPADVQLPPGKFVQIAFAIWNEANFERGAMKAVTSWWWFMAQPPPDRTIWIYTGLAVLGVIAVQVAVMRRVRRKR